MVRADLYGSRVQGLEVRVLGFRVSDTASGLG